MTAEEAEKFDRVRRNVQFGCTIKELAFLCRLIEKLDKVPAPPPPATAGKKRAISAP
jgi:hypothetical protein